MGKRKQRERARRQMMEVKATRDEAVHK